MQISTAIVRNRMEALSTNLKIDSYIFQPSHYRDVQPKDMATICQRGTHMPVFIAALFPLSNHETNIRDAY